jgi:hypothetical protein
MSGSIQLGTPELATALGIDYSPSDLVTIDWQAVDAMIRHLLKGEDFSDYHRLSWDDERYWNSEAGPEERSQYFAVGNSINFRFWQIEHDQLIPATGLIKGEQLRGSMYMWRSLRVRLAEGYPVLDARYLASISKSAFDALFTDDEGNNPLRTASVDRLKNLHDLGAVLQEQWRGQFHNLVKEAAGSLVAFARLSSAFRAYDDPLFKLTMVNAILHAGSGVARFHDEPLPGIDYHLLKQVIRQGLIQPSAPLGEKLMNGHLLTEHEATELRRMALYAFVAISKETGISGELLDNRWWSNRNKCTDLAPVCLDAARAHECPFLEPCRQLTDIGLPLVMTRYY